MIKTDRQKRIALLYHMLKSIGYKVDRKFFYRTTRDNLLFINILLLNKVAYLTGKEVVTVYNALQKTVNDIRKGFKKSPKTGYNTLVERQIESEYLDFLPKLLEHLDIEHFDNKPVLTSKHRLPKKYREPAETQADTQENLQE